MYGCYAEDAEAIEPAIETSRLFGLHRRARPQWPQSTLRLCPAVREANGALAGRTRLTARRLLIPMASHTALLTDVLIATLPSLCLASARAAAPVK